MFTISGRSSQGHSTLGSLSQGDCGQRTHHGCCPPPLRFIRRYGGLVGGWCCTWFASAVLLAADTVPPPDFARAVRPILAEKCLACHSGEKPKGGLRLGDRTGALGSGDSGLAAITPGKVADSEVVRRLESSDPDERMPPADEKPLTAAEIESIKQWIAAGAVWSQHWSLEPLGKPQPPPVSNRQWVRNPIDAFILARLEAQRIAPSPEADRYTLIKRLSYDLLGLPPTPAEADAFASDPAPDAYDRLVQRLLESPHFGERWGRHWLDLAHFADSDGFEKDRARPDAYLYRDWVIDAINRDLPFDQFTIQQLAGDLLPEATAKERIATGFLRQTLTNEEGGVDQEEFRVAACFDRTETVGTAWLGLTIGCVRCHEHKYDPLLHADYYKLFAFFNESEELRTSLPLEADDLDALEAKLRPLETQLAARYRELAPLALAWETAEHQRIMTQPEAALRETALEVAAVEASDPSAVQFQVQSDRILVSRGGSPSAEKTATGSDGPAAVATMPESSDFTVTLRIPPQRLTGFKVHALPHDALPNKGPGLGPQGNFVLTKVRATLISADGQAQPLELQRAKANFSQRGFSAEATLASDAAGKQGWAIGGKTGAAHWIQYRTHAPIAVPAGAVLRVDLEQRSGKQQLLGHFRIAALTGDERGLDIADESIANALEMYPEKRVASLRQQLFDYYVKEVARDAAAQSLRDRIAKLYEQSHARLVEVRTLGTPRLPRTTPVFHRGDFLSPKDEVAPGVPAVLPLFRPRGKRGDRLDLANWLVSRENFLTPRVAVNHVWQHLFGVGLVRTANDFGTRGELPTHPELLDWLAARFHGDLAWSRKELIRLIVSSAAYRQESRFRPEVEAVDPLNATLFRQNRVRVESETVRDLCLAVAGLLSPKIGGPSVFPPMPDDLAKLSYANNFSWANSTGDDRYRRGMYTFFKRTIPHPNLMTFDSPDANVACVRRTVSNTPLQALTLLNNEVHAEAAQALAQRVLAQTVNRSPLTDADRLAMALRLGLIRPVTQPEVAALGRTLAAARNYYAAHADDASKLLADRAIPSVPAAEAAAWIATVRVVLNLDEFVTRD